MGLLLGWSKASIQGPLEAYRGCDARYCSVSRESRLSPSQEGYSQKHYVAWWGAHVSFFLAFQLTDLFYILVLFFSVG